MDRINGADTTDIGGGRRGFRDENLVAGTPGTEVTALFLNMIQEEILRVITEAGIVPSDGDWTQFWQALQVLGLAPDRRRRWLVINSMTQASPPASPTVGDTYLIPTGATGLWAANIGNIAQWSGSSWSYVTPPDGHAFSLPDGRVFMRLAGAYTQLSATDTRQGMIELATSAEVQTGTDATRAVTPAGLAARTATETRTGVVELATVAEATTGTDTSRAVTPAGLTAAVTAAIANVINGSPAALDTLYELAAALGNDANFASTVTTALANKVDISRVATETVFGIIELATSAEVAAGTDTARAVTPVRLKERTDALTVSTQYNEWGYAVAAGTANALTAALAPVPAALTAGMVVVIRIATTNTGAATLNLNAKGVRSITSINGAALAAGDLPAGVPVMLIYSGTAWVLVGPSLSQVQLASIGQQQVFSANGTFVVPAGVTKLFVRVVGAGGGGGRGGTVYALSGGGGGAGGYAEKYISTTPGASFAVTIGVGGARGDTIGGTGGTTSFGSQVSATGGGGGRGQTGSCAGGAGGVGVGGDLNIQGGPGGDGNQGSANIQGGQGGASAFGGGGMSGDGGLGNGAAPGSGGGGAWGNTQAFGALGADGLVIVRW